ncbi:MAG: VIT domain-containing protein [bacterium JZ-2024 1]
MTISLFLLFLAFERILPSPLPPPLPIFWNEVAPKSLSVEMNVKDPQAEVFLKFTFHNPHHQATGEGVVLIPLPENALIDRLTMEMDGKELSGELLDRAKAEEIYESIVRRRKDPAILTYFSPRVLQAKIFPIPPGQSRNLSIRYITTVQVKKNSREIILPLVPALEKQPEKLSLKILLSASVPVRSLYSPDYEVHISWLNQQKAEVSFSGTVVEKTFRLFYSLSAEPLDALLISYKEPEEDGYFLLFLNPEIPETGEILPKDVAFVMDVSGSMAGLKLEQAKEAMKGLLDKLEASDRFNIVVFSSGVEKLSDRWLEVNSASLERAKKFVQRLDALGGTNISAALDEVFSLPVDLSRPRYILFLTDGNPTEGIRNWEELVRWVARRNEKSFRLYCFGIGNDVNIPFLDRLAEENGGTSEYTSQVHEVESAVSRLYEAFRRPVLSQISLNWSGAEVYDLYPKKIVDIFAGKTVSLAGRFAPGKILQLSVKGLLADREHTYKFSFPLPEESEEFSFLPRIWAGRKIAYLIDEMSKHGRNEETIRSIIELSKKYGVLTEYTAFLIEEPQLLRDISGAVRKLELPAVASGEAAMERQRTLAMMKGEERVVGTLPERLRIIEGQAFLKQDGRWVTTKYTEQTTKKIVLFSGEYFDLLKKYPRLAPILALGKGTIFEHRGSFYELIE